MNKSIVALAVTSIMVLAGYAIYQTHHTEENHQSDPPTVAATPVETKGEIPTVTATSAQLDDSFAQPKDEFNRADIVKKLTEEVLHNAESIDDGVNQALNGQITEADAALEMVKARFPELKEEIEHYQSDVAQQQGKLLEYQDMVQQRNSDLSKNSYVESGMAVELEQKKAELLTESKRLGEQAMRLNEAIRQAANIY